MRAFLIVLVLVLLLPRAHCVSSRPYYHFMHNNMTFVEMKEDIPPDSPTLQPDFDTALPNIAPRFYSDFGQDEFVDKFHKSKKSGYFVDLASNHFSIASNTYALEVFNKWNGICIEPNPQYLKELLAHRRCQVYNNPVTDKRGEEVKFRLQARGHGALGGIVKQEYDNRDSFPDDVVYHSTTLSDILDHAKAPRIMDYLSLDVEGAELEVLKSLNFTKYRFLMLTIERPTMHAHEFISKHGFRYCFTFNGGAGECVYLHHTLDGFKEYMDVHRDTLAPTWTKRSRPYVLNPVWNGSYYPYV
jgi:FkbM family methyltransferase